MTDHVWTVRTAKAKLSEVLRLTREVGPQRIGERDACIVVAESEWLRLNRPQPHFGTWLLENMPKVEELELPDRKDRSHRSSFGEP